MGANKPGNATNWDEDGGGVSGGGGGGRQPFPFEERQYHLTHTIGCQSGPFLARIRSTNDLIDFQMERSGNLWPFFLPNKPINL